MCPNCTFCSKRLEEDFVKLNHLQIGKTVICIECITAFKEVLDITEIEERLGYLKEDLDEIKEKI